MPVYFIRAGEDGLVKIGHATDVARRLSHHRVSSPMPLSLVREMPGGLVEEQWLHRHYRKRHAHGEWFEFCPTMLTIDPPQAEIEALETPAWAFRIASARTASGLTQAGLGKVLGVAQTTIASWERGINEPRLGHFERIAALTRTTASWLAFGDAPTEAA